MPVILSEPKASIFEQNANILVNPVNTQGTMGKGLARQFAKKYPLIVPIYKEACAKGNLVPGSAYIMNMDELGIKTDHVDHIVLFTSKGDWRNASRLCWIKSGLHMLAQRCNDYFKSEDVVAIPKIGAGLGGLKEDDVIRMIQSELEFVPQKVILCV